jgi:hypothetical protein
MGTRVRVPFSGPGAGVGPLTWGQRQCWRAMVATGTSLPMGAVMTPRPGLTVEDYARTLAFWMSRYAALRTRLRLSDPLVQVVAGSGEAELLVLPGDEVTARELLAAWKGTPFDYEDEWPVRLAVITDGDTVTRAVMVICHLAGDAASVEVMNRELVDPDPGPYTAPQPIELARLQETSGRHSRISLRYWEAQLRTVPPTRFRAGTHHGYRRVTWDSPAAYDGLRGHPDSGAVLLGAFAIALRELSSPLVAQVIVGNRFRPGLADVVSPLTQNGLCVLDVDGADLATAAGRARSALMAASKHAYYDPGNWLALVEASGVELGILWNDRRMGGAGAPTAATRQPVHDQPMAYFNEQLMVNVEDVPGTVRVTAELDTRFLGTAELLGVLDRMEAVIGGRAP